jgi:transketolase
MTTATETTATVQKRDLRDAMIEAFIQAVEKGVPLMVVVADSTSTSKIGAFASKYPERIVNAGIAEQNMVGIAAGLALGGYTAVTCNAAPFLVARANEQVKNDVCYSKTNVKLVGLNAGFTYSNLGSTHHAIDDIAIMRGFGNIRIFAPADAVEAAQVFMYALTNEGPMYIRMDNAQFPVIHDSSYVFTPGKADVVMEGSDITVCAMGSVTGEAWEAARELVVRGISVELLNIASLRPFPREEVIRSLQKTGKVITVEEHSVCGGLGSFVAEAIAEEGIACRLRRLGIEEGHFAKCGPRPDVRAYHHIDKKGIIETVLSM